MSFLTIYVYSIINGLKEVGLIFIYIMFYYVIIILMKTVYVGMSGGVDSSVSALLLKEQGYNVVGIYMKNWSEDLPGMKCPWAEDLADAKRIAVKLGIDFEVWDFEKEYRKKVVDYMLDEFKKVTRPILILCAIKKLSSSCFTKKPWRQGQILLLLGIMQES